MKTIVETATKQSKYLFEDNKALTMNSDSIIVGKDPVDFIVMDLNKEVLDKWGYDLSKVTYDEVKDDARRDLETMEISKMYATKGGTGSKSSARGAKGSSTSRSKGGSFGGKRRSGVGRKKRCDIRCKFDISILTNQNLIRDDLANVAYFVKELREK